MSEFVDQDRDRLLETDQAVILAARELQVVCRDYLSKPTDEIWQDIEAAKSTVLVKFRDLAEYTETGDDDAFAEDDEFHKRATYLSGVMTAIELQYEALMAGKLGEDFAPAQDDLWRQRATSRAESLQQKLVAASCLDEDDPDYDPRDDYMGVLVDELDEMLIENTDAVFSRATQEQAERAQAVVDSRKQEVAQREKQRRQRLAIVGDIAKVSIGIVIGIKLADKLGGRHR